MIKSITSTQNETVKYLCSLHHAKYRKKEDRFIVQTERAISTLMSKMQPLQFFMTQEVYDKQTVTQDISRITLVTPQIMQKISTLEQPAGMVALFDIPHTKTTTLNKGIVLANVSNPGNMGTLIRSAAAMNCSTVIIVEGTDPWDPKVVQATAGALALVDILQLSWNELLAVKKNLKLCALVVKDGQSPDTLKRNDILIVIGNEATGIPASWLATCELTCTLPMPGNTESLNAAVAGSIALYIAFVQK